MESASQAVEAGNFLASRLDDIPARTMLASTVLRRDPREVPRRLRALLLTIDGRRTVRDYVERLKGFGDVAALIKELYHSGMLELRSGRKAAPAGHAEHPGDSSQGWESLSFAEEALILDQFHSPDHIVRTLSAETQPAPLMARQAVAAAHDDLEVPTDPMPLRRTGPADTVPSIESQVEALFVLLDSVRGERQMLRRRIETLMTYRDKYKPLRAAYDRLLRRNQVLAAALIGLGAVLVISHALR